MNKWALLLSVVLGIGAAWLVYDYGRSLEQSEAGLSYLRLAPGAELPRGEQLLAEEIETVNLPERFSDMASYAIPDTEQNRSWITGRVASQDIAGGALILFEHFTDMPSEKFSAEITPGMRAMSISVNPSSAVAFFIEPGSRIDLIGTFIILEQKSAEEVTGIKNQNGQEMPTITVESLVAKTMMQNIKVLAVGGAASVGSYHNLEGGYGTVTIEVSPEQAELIAFAMPQLEGELTVVLRNPSDAEKVSIPRVDWELLSGKAGVR